MSELSINLGFIILGVIAVYLAIIFICNIIQDNLKKYYNKAYDKGYVEAIIEEKSKNDKFKDTLAEFHFNKAQQFWLKTKGAYQSEVRNDEYMCEVQSQMDKKQAIAEQFCDDLQRMKTLEEYSEKFQKLHLVKKD